MDSLNLPKCFRALEVLQQKGQKLSDIFEEQQKSEGGSILGGGLRYLNAVVLWLQCEQVNTISHCVLCTFLSVDYSKTFDADYYYYCTY